MQLSARLAAIASLVFGLTCLGFAIDGFTSLPSDPVEAESARQFAWFWVFLGVVGVAMAWGTWLVALKRERDGE